MPTMRSQRNRRAGNVAAIMIALVVLVVLAAVVYFLMSQKPKAGAMLESSQKMAPESTQVYLAYDLTSAGPLADEAKQKEFLEALKGTKAFKTFTEDLNRELNINFEQEVMNWAKPSAALVLGPAEGQTSLATLFEKEDPKMASGFLVLGVKDDAAARATMDKVMKDEPKFKGEDYKGAHLWIPEGGVEQGPTLALSPGMFFIGLNEKDVKSALDGPAKSLKDNAGFKAAMDRTKHKDLVVGYVDLQGIIKGAPLNEIPPEAAELKNLLMGLRAITLGGGMDGKDIVHEYSITIDPATSGKLSALIFKPEFGMDVKTVDLYPQDCEMYGCFNLKMVWQIIYDLLGEFPETKMYQQLPAMQLSQQGIDLQKDILDPLTGEVAYNMTGYGKMFSSQVAAISEGREPDPSETEAAMREMPITIAVSLAQKEKIQELMDKFIPEPVRQQFKTTDYNGVKIFNVEDQFYYAMVDDFMVLGINKAEEDIKKMIDAKKSGKSVKSAPGYSKVMGMLGDDKPIALSFVDTEKVYGQAIKDLGSQDASLAKLLTLSMQDYSGGWGAVSLRKDGLYGVSVMTHK